MARAPPTHRAYFDIAGSRILNGQFVVESSFKFNRPDTFFLSFFKRRPPAAASAAGSLDQERKNGIEWDVAYDACLA
jgi:hypothetical protein